MFPKREYIFAVSDRTSVAKIERFEREEVQGAGEYEHHFVPRAREVGQSYFTSIFTTLLAFWHSWRGILEDETRRDINERTPGRASR